MKELIQTLNFDFNNKVIGISYTDNINNLLKVIREVFMNKSFCYIEITISKNIFNIIKNSFYVNYDAELLFFTFSNYECYNIRYNIIEEDNFISIKANDNIYEIKCNNVYPEFYGFKFE